MSSGWIVEAFHELENRDSGFGLGVESAAVQEFAFEGGEKALAHGVIEAVSDRTHRRANSGLPAPLAEGDRGVLASLVRVVNDVRRSPVEEGHVEGVEHEFGSEMGFHRPAHDPPAPGVQDDREVEESGPSRDV